jgi:shikimate dehydrogenase
MHNTAYALLGLDLQYLAFAVHEERLGEAVQSIRALGMLGANVTVPHKEAVLAYLDEVADDARIGSVNTIVHHAGRLIGHSTDGPAFFYALQAECPEYDSLRHPLLIIGSGGAARAIAGIYTARQGLAVTLVDLLPEKAAGLARDLRQLYPDSATQIISVGMDLAVASLASYPLIVNATPVGMWPRVDAAPLLLPPDLPKETIIADIIYNPGETRLLCQARQSGLRSVNGVGMLVWQAALAIELWTGHQPDIGAMRQALLNFIRSKDSAKVDK